MYWNKNRRQSSKCLRRKGLEAFLASALFVSREGLESARCLPKSMSRGRRTVRAWAVQETPVFVGAAGPEERPPEGKARPPCERSSVSAERVSLEKAERSVRILAPEIRPS